MNNKRLYSALVFTLLFISNGFSQKIDLGNYEMEILEIVQKKSISSLGQLIFPHKNKKYVGINVLLLPKTKKNEGISLESLLVKSNTKEYPMSLAIGHSATGGGQGKFINLRKAKKKTLYAEVPKNFKEGILYYEENKLGTIKISIGSKTGTFTVQSVE